MFNFSPAAPSLWEQMERLIDRHQIEAVEAAPTHPRKPPFKPRAPEHDAARRRIVTAIARRGNVLAPPLAPF